MKLSLLFLETILFQCAFALQSMLPKSFGKSGRCSYHRGVPNPGTSSSLFISFGWFSGKDDKNNQQKNEESASISKDGKGGLGGVAGVMESMERYKKAQRVGKMTASVVQDLASMTVEGVAKNGKVRIILDGQQRAVKTILVDGYFESASASELANALTEAIKDGHTKSSELMSQITKKFYAELQDGILDFSLSSSENVDRMNNSASKATQKNNRLKASLNQDLSSNTVEGSAEDGKVKAIYNCQQKPISVFIDEAYFEAAFLSEDVCDAITEALQDAYTKSAERMDEKMKGFYSELGLTSQ